MSYFEGEVCCGLDPVVLCQDPYSGQLLCDPLQPTQALQLPSGQIPPTARLLQLVSAQQAAVTTAGSGSNSSISSSSSNNSSSGVFSALPYSTVSQSMLSTGSMLQLMSAHQPALSTASSGSNSSSSSSSNALNALPYGTVNLLGITDAAPYNLLPIQSQQSLQSLPQLLEPLQLLQQPAQPPSFQQQTHQLHLSQPQQQQQLAEQQQKLAHVLPQQLLEPLQLQQPPLYPFLAAQRQQQQTLAHVLPLVHPLQQPQPQQQQLQQQQQQHPAAIFFARAHADVSTEQLLGVFAQFGRVMDIDLFRPFRGLRLGCGMVVFSSRLEAAAAVETLHGRFVWPGARGPMVVEWCDPNKHYSRKQPPSAAPGVLQQVQRLQQQAVTHTSGVQSTQRILPTGGTGGSFSLGMLPNDVGAPRTQLVMPRY